MLNYVAPGGRFHNYTQTNNKGTNKSQKLIYCEVCNYTISSDIKNYNIIFVIYLFSV